MVTTTEAPVRHLLDVRDVARWLGTHPNWVYDRSEALGAIRLGDGPNAPLRFDPDRIEDWLAEHRRGA